MSFVTRYQVQDLEGRMWDGFGFTAFEDCAEEYRDLEEAEQAAVECGGEVVEYQRFSRYPDPSFFPTPYSTLQAAE